MGRKERRIQKKLEKNPIGELNKIQNRFYSPKQILQPALLEIFPDKRSPASQLYHIFQSDDAGDLIL